jgi:hypothetical protein
MRSFWLLSTAALIVSAVPAQADQTRDALAEFAKCSAVTVVIERLQCYDNAAVAAKMALAAPPGAAQQQASVETDADGDDEGGGVLSWFGLSSGGKPARKAEEFGRPPARAEGPKEITEISSRITKITRNPLGGAIFTLENGQVWTQISGDTTEVRDLSPTEDGGVKIERSFFGSYSLVFDERKGLIKVRRTK